MSPQKNHVTIVLLTMLVCFCTARMATAAANGKLTVVTDPSNVTLWIDGQLVGQTPLLQHQLSVGWHTIHLVDQTQQLNDTRTIEIVEDSAVVLNVSLQKEFGTLTVTSKPDSAEVFLLTRIGRTPVTDDQIVPGAYTVEVRHPNHGYLVSTDNIIVEKDKTYPLNKTLARQKLLTTKNCVQLGLGAASLGCYIWGYAVGREYHPIQAGWAFGVGTALLCSVEVVALF